MHLCSEVVSSTFCLVTNRFTQEVALTVTFSEGCFSPVNLLYLNHNPHQSQTVSTSFCGFVLVAAENGNRKLIALVFHLKMQYFITDLVT